MLKEFKEFLMRGNVVDLAVAVIIGAAFKAIVDSLVNDIFNPVISAVFNAEAIEGVTLSIGSITFNVGSFAASVINFIIVGAVLFTVVKLMNKASELTKKKEEPVEMGPAAPTSEQLLAEIRDLLAEKK